MAFHSAFFSARSFARASFAILRSRAHFALKGLRFFNFLSDLRSVMPDDFYLERINRALKAHITSS